MKRANAHPMTLAVEQSLERYFADLEGAKPAGIYDMVILTVEKPMLQRVMLEAGGNQLRASECLASIETPCAKSCNNTVYSTKPWRPSPSYQRPTK